MMKTGTPKDRDDQEIKLLEEWLPVLSERNRAYLKGVSEALLYVQEDLCTTEVEQSGPGVRALKE